MKTDCTNFQPRSLLPPPLALSPSSTSSHRHLSSSALVGERTSLLNWHSRLGHPTFCLCSSIISKLQLPTIKNKMLLTCPACHMSKSKQLSFSESTTHVHHPLELIYTDVWRPSPMFSTTGNKYYVSVLDAVGTTRLG